MHLHLTTDQLVIELTGTERLWAFHVGKTIMVPLSHIRQVSTEAPQGHWSDLRAPGTFMPGVIKAGTYYTRNGREFWYAINTPHFLTLNLSEKEYYKRIVLTLEDNENWADQIRQRCF